MAARPYVEAVALLAAHGLYDPAAFAPTTRRWRAALEKDIAYALLTDERLRKPIGFPDLDALARHIHRVRGDGALEFVDVEDLEVRSDITNRPGVTVFLLDAGGDRDRLIGHAWLDGRGQEALKVALKRTRASDRKAA